MTSSSCQFFAPSSPTAFIFDTARLASRIADLIDTFTRSFLPDNTRLMHADCQAGYGQFDAAAQRVG